MGLVLAERVRQGATVTLSYRDPTSGNDVRALQDGAGNDAASFTDREVVNRSEVADGNAQDAQFAEPPTNPLTVSAETKPERASEFDVEIAFSDALHDFSFRTLKEHAITVTGGEIVNASRTVPRQSQRWRVRVKPAGEGEVTLTLNPIPNAVRTTTSARRTAAGWRRAWR